MKIGDRVYGRVDSITSYGAFLKAKGKTGLLHVNDMSWGRISHPSEVVRKGEVVKIVVMHIDEERNKYSFGMKQLQTNPWNYAHKKYRTGRRYRGTVINMTTDGIFVKLDEFITGFLHTSKFKGNPWNKFPVSAKITVNVDFVDTERWRIGLSAPRTIDP